MDGLGTKCRRNIAEKLNRLSREHERYRRQTDDRQTDDRQTDGRQHIANVNVSSRSLKMNRRGPRTYPCGTEQTKGADLEYNVCG